jgi:integrase
MSVRLDQSKTDPFRRGTDVTISNPQAIKYMLAYLHRRNQRLSRLPLFVGNDGQALTASALVKFTQQLIVRAEIPNAHLFLGHSFRKGGATSLHEAGYPDSLIKIMGRWASFAFATYIDTPLHMIIEAGRSLSRNVDRTHVLTRPSSFWDVSNLHL